MKKLLILLSLGLIVPQVLFAVGETRVANSAPNNKGLLIFLDDSEHNFGALTQDFSAAIIQEAGPIVVSKSLFANMLEVKTPEEIEGNLAMLAKNKIAVEFDANKWVIKEINDSAYLLLPTKDLAKQNIK